MGDVDKFKNYNTKYGHPQGDTALSYIAGIFRKSIEDTTLENEQAFIFRYGGEELGAFIENFQGDSRELKRRANLVCEGVRDFIIPQNNESIFENPNDKDYKRKTITLAGSISEKNESAERLMGRVDGLLNKLKNNNLRGKAKIK